MTQRRFLLCLLCCLLGGTMLLPACGDEGADDPTPAANLGKTFTTRGDVYHYIYEFNDFDEKPVFAGAHKVIVPADRNKLDAIDSANQPSRLHPELGQNNKYDPSQTEGESDWPVFASNWWNQAGNGIAKRWAGDAPDDYNDVSDKDDLSPAEKYDLLFNPGQPQQIDEVEHWSAADVRKPEDERGEKHKHEAINVAGPATKWELENHGVYQTRSHPDSWWGHCNGWASYATTDKAGAPVRDIRVKVEGGEVTECVGELADDPACMLVRMGDMEALMSELYFSDSATFAGRRCNTDPEKVERDQYGRPTEDACRDLNAGAFHIGVTGLLTKGADHLGTNEPGKPAFIIDHNYDWEVWNFPLVRYTIDSAEEITAEEANAAIGAEGSDYEFNDDATNFVRVEMRYWMVSDGVSDAEMLKPATERNVDPHEVSLRYILELDDSGAIIGGEWLKVPSTSWGVTEEKEIHPDFYWMGVSHKGWGESDDDLGGHNDNPFIAYSHVKALIDCANDASSCAPAVVDPDPSGGCVDACGAQGAGGCWCDASCTSYGDCCSNYAEVCTGDDGNGGVAADSCEGRCGEQAPDGCWCDDQCEGFEDCCADKADHCTE